MIQWSVCRASASFVQDWTLAPPAWDRLEPSSRTLTTADWPGVFALVVQMPKGQNLTVKERFDARWILCEEGGHWVWVSTNDGRGYGEFFIKGVPTHRAHRVAWLLYRGPIPEGMLIDHVCRVRYCVNPDHLRVVTHRENSTENSISPPARNAAKTHCIRGHPLSGPNLYRWALGGRRYCRACRVRRDKLAGPRSLRKTKARPFPAARPLSPGDDTHE